MMKRAPVRERSNEKKGKTGNDQRERKNEKKSTTGKRCPGNTVMLITWASTGGMYHDDDGHTRH